MSYDDDDDDDGDDFDDQDGRYLSGLVVLLFVCG